jgi:glycosyltransferase involved in cell wall biosynthesis
MGIKKATGKYIMFIDQDDIYEKNACEIAYNKIIEYNLPVIFYNFNDIDISYNLKTQCWYNIKNDTIIYPSNKKTKNKLYKISSCPWCKILDKQFIKKMILNF